MRKNAIQKLIESHLVEGRMEPGEEIALKIDQTLTQDVTGTMAMLEFEAMGMARVRAPTLRPNHYGPLPLFLFRISAFMRAATESYMR